MKSSAKVMSVAAFLGVMALSGPASAATALTATVGPVPVPGVPVEVCVVQTGVGVNNCVTGPPSQSVTLSLAVSLDDIALVVVLPVVSTVACPSGTSGVGLRVYTGSVRVTVAGSVPAAVNGLPATIPIAKTAAGPNQTVTVLACAGLSAGV